MLVKALKSFGGKISMYEGEVREVSEADGLKDLLGAGYVEPEVQEAEIVEKPAPKAKKPAKAKKK